MLRSLITVCLLCCVNLGLSQSVIVNEMSQGASGGQEWIELLILENNVNLQGWEIGDADDGNWHSIATFTQHASLSAIARGTILVVYNSGDVDPSITSRGGEDLDFSDKSVLIPVNNTDYLIEDGPWGLTGGAFANSDADDCAAIRNMADVIIHDLAGSHPTPVISGPGSGEVLYFTGNSTSLLQNTNYWSTASAAEATPGVGNGGDNSNWIDTSLPVHLGVFEAQSFNGEVLLTWQTESEIDNQGFVIERKLRVEGESGSQRSPVVEVWSEIASFLTNPELQGQGSSSHPVSYTFLDKDVQIGKQYSYQLSDVDYTGKVTRHPSITVAVTDFDPDLRPSAITLYPAYPNPFNPLVQLSFSLDVAVNDLSFAVYDIQGALVQTLGSGAQQAGYHTFNWTGIDLSGKQVGSGIYLVRLASAGEVMIQRITLLR